MKAPYWVLDQKGLLGLQGQANGSRTTKLAILNHREELLAQALPTQMRWSPTAGCAAVFLEGQLLSG